MANNIVTLNVSQTVAPAPSTLQRTGVLVSQGGSNAAPGSLTLLTQLSDLTNALSQPAPIASMVWAAGVVTVTTSAPHGFTVGDAPFMAISAVVPGAYNGNFAVTITGANSFTYPLTLSPGTVTGQGFWVSGNAATLLAMATTFFAQGSGVGVSVLELGPRSPASAVIALGTWLTANPLTIYNLLLPRNWNGGTPGLLALIAQYESVTAKTNFFITTTLTDYVNFTALMNCVFAFIEAPTLGAYPGSALTALTWANGVATATSALAHNVQPGQWFTLAGVTPAGYNGTWLALPGTAGQTLVFAFAPSIGAQTAPGTLVASTFSTPGAPLTEFGCAAPFHVALNYDPSSVNLVTPFAFSYLVGVTPFPIRGNAALMATLKAANVNWVGTGAEGGISNAVLFWGTMMDGRDFTYWYSVDWVQLSIDRDLSNDIINGSNNPLAPLYYDQNGINRLQARAQATMNRAVTYGLALAPIVVNAVPFATYVLQNPSDYPVGTYNGLSVTYTPNRGFKSITFSVVVSDFPAA